MPLAKTGLEQNLSAALCPNPCPRYTKPLILQTKNKKFRRYWVKDPRHSKTILAQSDIHLSCQEALTGTIDGNPAVESAHYREAPAVPRSIVTCELCSRRNFLLCSHASLANPVSVLVLRHYCGETSLQRAGVRSYIGICYCEYVTPGIQP